MKLQPLKVIYGIFVSLLTWHVFWGCTINPVTKRPNFVLTTQEGERRIGEKEAQKVAQTMGLTDDPELVAYVHAIGNRLAAHSPRKDVEYQFFIVEMNEPNAFALPGGFIYVSRGLLPLTNSEAELAGVLGHEIGHVAARHSIQRLSAAAPFAIVGGVAGTVTGIVSDRLSNVVTGITGFAGNVLLAPYSRNQERQADEVGIELAADSGWDPAGLSHFLHTLGRYEEQKQPKSKTVSFFNTHPSTPERVEATIDHAKEVTHAGGQPIVKDHASFLEKLDGLVIGRHPAEGMFEDNLFLQPDLNFAIRFPNGWESQNSREAILAVEKDTSVFSLLTVAGQGDDPMSVVQALDKKSDGNILNNVERFQIGQLSAARIVLETRTKQGPTAVDLTWIAYDGDIYQIIGGSKLDLYKKYAPTFRQVAQSFRPLTSFERNRITIARLRLVQAHEGESIQNLIVRTESEWTVDQTALANGLERETILESGQLVKIAKREPYLPRKK